MTRYRDYGTEREPVDEPTDAYQTHPGHPDGPRAVAAAIVLSAVMVVLCVAGGLLGYWLL